ncbi:uncharacterized protein LOC106761670 [Vigna radiata var. radiata]|uniref:Uncharacterized protein LOC106761670 n=1 Tax=Vigna radiata var. radiata TaxID=3916 RepID=A0A3Q0EW91_VIGRR|nr:uncharacterized protein LOC106761670 [Vigna radiata var. radiata]
MTNQREQKDVVIDIRKKLKEAGPPITKECSIYRVPFDIRKHNADAYTPKIVSIGPLHHNAHPGLQNMERHKLIYCNSFLERTHTDVDTWIRYIEKIEPDLRRYYSETLQFSKEELVNIILVDSGFIFELFWKDYNKKDWTENDTFLLIPLIRDTVAVDLFLFENQIPFHVLTNLFELSRTTGSDAGVHFKVLNSDCLLDLKFSGGVLQMPKLKVEDRTEVLFRNMVALEQCHYPLESYITDYVCLLDFLINSSRDVDTLVQQEVLVNWTGDTDTVVNLFNSLGKNITQSNMNSNYLIVSHGLNYFYRNIFNKLKSTLRRDYCDSPWQTAATIAAIVLLVLSVIQTVCSIISVLPQE